MKELENLCYEILDKMSKLNITKFTFGDKEYLYKWDKTYGIIYISSIEYDPIPFPYYDNNLSSFLTLMLSDGTRLPLVSLHIEKIKLIEKFKCDLEDAIYRRDHYKKESWGYKLHIENKDIIITDPYYIIKKKIKDNNLYPILKKDELIRNNGWDKNNLTIEQCLENYRYNLKCEEDYDRQMELYIASDFDDWSKCNYGDNMEALGLKNFLISNTIYGDWSCTTYNTNTKEPIGEFCADTGEVGVFLLDEVLAYNPDFDNHINKTWTTTWLKKFTGDVWIEKRHHEGVYDDTTDYHKKGDKWGNDSIHVVGIGNVNFETQQTAF